MIVTCENCETSFQLDESRVPEQGIRVRCSRCKEAFFLAHPSASAEDAIHGAANEAVQSPGGPGPAEDLDGRPGGEDEEHDWEFNVDPSPAAHDDTVSGFAAEDPAAAGESDLALDDAEQGDSGLSLEGEEDVVGSMPAAGAEESAFGSVDDYSSLMEEDAAEQPPDLGDATPSLEQPGQTAAAGQYASEGRSDDLGDPESWDFFADDAPNASSASAGNGGGAVLGRIALTSASPTALLSTDVWEEADDFEQEDVAPPGLVLRTFGLLGHTIGWTITLGMVGVALVSGFFGTAESLVHSPQDLELGSIRAEGVRARWVDTARGETLLSVRADLVNTAAAPAMLDGILEIALVDETGAPVEADAAPMGVEIAEQDLRELTPESLRIVSDRAAWSLAHGSLTPRARYPVQAVFREVPPDAVRLALSVTEGVGVSTIATPQPGAVVDDATALDARAGAAQSDGSTTSDETGELDW